MSWVDLFPTTGVGVGGWEDWTIVSKWEAGVQILSFCNNVIDLPQSLSEAGCYLYANRTSVIYQHNAIKKMKKIYVKSFRHYADCL